MIVWLNEAVMSSGHPCSLDELLPISQNLYSQKDFSALYPNDGQAIAVLHP